jgi:hypothetical protein
MKLLNEAIARTTIRLTDIEHEARSLLSELDTLERRLHRAHGATCIDAFVAYFNMERKQILEDEERTKTGASLAGFPALGIYGLFSLFSGKKPNWGRAVSEAFREQPFGDVRIAGSRDGIKAVNVSKMAREQNMSVAGVLAYLEAKGNKVLTWSGFEAKAKNLRMAVLKGEVTLLGKEETKLQLKPHGLPRFVSSEIRLSG